MPPIPITIITGFLGSGKTTLILNLIPQLPKSYKLALLKNEFGDLAIDSQLASSSAIGGVQELLNGCICCNLVGQLGDALETLRTEVQPDRIIIETSGSAFPATLAMEVNRLGRETGHFVLDGVVVVIDVENWQGYDDTSYTAKLQARYTDLIVFNKWECVDERRYEDCLDRVGDIDLQVAHVKSVKGLVDQALLLGLESAWVQTLDAEAEASNDPQQSSHDAGHHSEVEVLSVALWAPSPPPTSDGGVTPQAIDLDSLEMFLLAAPKDEIYRIKAILATSRLPTSSDGTQVDPSPPRPDGGYRYILNWAFGRWTFTPTTTELDTVSLPPPAAARDGSGRDGDGGADISRLVLRMTVVCARDESAKWMARLKEGELLRLEAAAETRRHGGELTIKRLS